MASEKAGLAPGCGVSAASTGISTGSMTRVAAFQFLCGCLAGRKGDIPPRAAKDFTWASFVTVAHEHSVASAIPFALRRLGLWELLPADVADYFDCVAKAVRQRNDELMAQATTVAEILNGIGVTPIFLKGGANLLRGLYPDSAMRTMADLDLLIPAGSAAQCLNSLKENGFEQLTDYEHPRGHHYPALGRPGSLVSLELHHRVLAHPYDRFLIAEEVRDGAIVLRDHEARLGIPSPTCAIIHNIAHAQLGNHGYIYGWIDLRSLLDFKLLSDAYTAAIDWEEIGRRFSRLRGSTALNFHLCCAQNLLGIAIPGHDRTGTAARLLFRRAKYQTGKPKLADRGARAIRPWLLLRRELSDWELRRRLVRHMMDHGWWSRHFRMLRGR